MDEKQQAGTRAPGKRDACKPGTALANALPS